MTSVLRGGGSKAAAHRRAVQAWDLRAMGYQWSEVASVCGYGSASSACASVRAWMRRLPPVDLEQHRTEAISRLGWLLRRAYEDVEQDKPGAVTAAVRVEQRLSELLGMDRPTEVVLHTPTASELERWVATVAGAALPGVVEADICAGPGELGPGPVEGEPED